MSRCYLDPCCRRDHSPCGLIEAPREQDGRYTGALFKQDVMYVW